MDSLFAYPDSEPIVFFSHGGRDISLVRHGDHDEAYVRGDIVRDLLAACEAIVAYTERGEGAGWRVTEMAKAAIAKVRGEADDASATR